MELTYAGGGANAAVHTQYASPGLPSGSVYGDNAVISYGYNAQGCLSTASFQPSGGGSPAPTR